MTETEFVFETERLLVRNLIIEDLDGFHEMQSDPLVMRYVMGKPCDRQQNEAELKRCIECYDQPDNDFWIWAIVEKATGAFVGTCAVVPDTTRPERNPEIGFRFIRASWGKGFGKESADGLIQYCIEERQVPALIAYVDTRNVASVKILESSRLTFIEDGVDVNGDPEKVFRWNRI